MVLTRGRILRQASVALAAGESAGVSDAVRVQRQRRRAEDLADAHEAKKILADARMQAQAILESAGREAEALRSHGRDEGRQEGAAEWVAARLLLLQGEESRLAGDRERWVALARLLAERLLGAELALSPERVACLARQVLLDVRLSQKAVLFAHPDDARALARDPALLGLAQGVLEIREDPDLGRGSLRVRSDVGNLEADLSLQLDSLLSVLRDSLQRNV